MRDGLGFKLGVSSAFVAEIIFLAVMLFGAVGEYNGTNVETIGFFMVTLCSVVAFGIFGYSIIQVLRLKLL